MTKAERGQLRQAYYDINGEEHWARGMRTIAKLAGLDVRGHDALNKVKGIPITDWLRDQQRREQR